MLNILIVGLMNVKGGIEQLIYQIFKRLGDEFHCDFLSYSPKCAYEDEFKAAGSTVYHITRRGENPVKCRKELKAFYQAHPDTYDYIWFHASSTSNVMGHIYAKRYTNAQIISHSHGTHFESRRGFVHAAHTFLHTLHRKKYIRCTDYCFACSKAAGKWLFGDTEKPVVIINNGIEIDRFRFSAPVRERIRNSIDIREEILIGHIGRFCEVKNQNFVLDIFYEVLQKNSSCRLFFAGEGEQLEQIKQKAKALGIYDHVFFAGFRNDPNCIMQAFDILLLPSLHEGMPVTVIEAQDSGLPCILSDTIPQEAAVTNLVEYMSLTNSPLDWAQKILDMVMAYQNNDRSRYAQVLLENGYNIEGTVKKLENFLLTHNR